MDLVALRAVGVGYHRRSILPPVDLVVRRGTFLGIVGPNGSGKTTLVRTLLGLLRPVSGRVEHPAGRSPRFGYVPQRSDVPRYFPLTTHDMVLMGRYPRRGLGAPTNGHDRDVAHEALRRVGLSGMAHRPLDTLSGGQRQRALIARALASDPEVLVLDEPTTGMDLVAEHALLDLIRGLHDQDRIGVVMISHHLALVAGFVSEVLLIDGERQAIEYGPVGEVVTSSRLSALYQRPVVVAEQHGHHLIYIDNGQKRAEREP
jgi:ABC-type Mn2+/Zn2+ transport system ATPase subunit